jgi:hypothetical protein
MSMLQYGSTEQASGHSVRLRRLATCWVKQIANPRVVLRGIFGLLTWYIRDFVRYSRQTEGGISLWDAFPQVHDRTKSTSIDAHYYFVNSWAMRRIVAIRPCRHVDVGSQVVFTSLLSAIVPVMFIDYRPLVQAVPGLHSIGGDIVRLPLRSRSVSSLSCLHVAEHIGLGRYGEPLDPMGTRTAISELTRVLAPGGSLFFAVPVGVPRVCFNAHRIHSANTILEHFRPLNLEEFSGVHDDGRYVEHVELTEFDRSYYACGMFWFTRAR